MELPANYHRDGTYYYTYVDANRVEVILEPKGQKAEKVYISDQAYWLLKQEVKFSRMKLVWDDKEQPWLKLKVGRPHLHQSQLPAIKQTTWYYRIKQKQCPKRHIHGPDCVDAMYRYETIPQKKGEYSTL